jgi:hypothetical protein
MRRPLLAIPVLALSVCLWAAAGEKEDKSTRVGGTFVIPAKVGSFAGHLVDIRLYKFHPLLADKAADLVDQVKLEDFAHTEGKETREAFVIGAKGTLEPKMKYYVTLFILKDGKRTHMGKDARGTFLSTVLTHGQPRKITLNVREVGRR